jgi:hypothetical protein
MRGEWLMVSKGNQIVLLSSDDQSLGKLVLYVYKQLVSECSLVVIVMKQKAPVSRTSMGVIIPVLRHLWSGLKRFVIPGGRRFSLPFLI